ncbi:MAG: hypothetical protein NVS2B7_13670 [Herpetosiphon sp.]
MLPVPRAIVIARPIWLAVHKQPFVGQVVGRFDNACNMMDRAGRVVTITSPALGNGPFFIVIDAAPDFFFSLLPYQPVHIDSHHLSLGTRTIPLHTAEVWNPTLPTFNRPLRLPSALKSLLQPWTAWPPSLPATAGPVNKHTTSMLTHGARLVLEAALGQIALDPAVHELAGLGPGLTPAGDDYLLGLMVALWLLSERSMLATIAQAAMPRTTSLSGAFLAAAGQGQVVEGWHHLVRALHRHDPVHTAIAIERISAIGATSGRDALAGFTQLLLRSLEDTV